MCLCKNRANFHLENCVINVKMWKTGRPIGQRPAQKIFPYMVISGRKCFLVLTIFAISKYCQLSNCSGAQVEAVAYCPPKKRIVSYPIFTSSWNKFQLLYTGASVRFLQHTSAYDTQNHIKPIMLITVKTIVIVLYTFLNISFPHFLLTLTLYASRSNITCSSKMVISAISSPISSSPQFNNWSAILL